MPRLGISGGDREAAAVLLGKFGADIANALHIAEDALGNFQHGLPRRRNRHNAFAVPHKQLHAQLVFQQLYLLGNARLGRKQNFRRLRNIQIAAVNLQKIAQLLQFHDASK